MIPGYSYELVGKVQESGTKTPEETTSKLLEHSATDSPNIQAGKWAISPSVTGLEHGPGRTRMPSVRSELAFVWLVRGHSEDRMVAWLDPREGRTCAP